MKITDGLFLAASGASGFGLTHPLDCNCFLVSDGNGHHLFDAGAGLDVTAILGAMEGDGLDPGKLRTVFLTHGHADHSGGAAELARRVNGLRLLAGEKTAAILRSGDERLISLDRARGPVYPLDYTWTAPEVHEIVADGATVAAGGFSVTLLPTPGHSGDHVSWRVSGNGLDALVAGDALFADGKIFLQDIEDCSVSRSIATVRMLAEIDFESLLPGHGRFLLKGGKGHVEAAMRHVEKGLLPPQLH